MKNKIIIIGSLCAILALGLVFAGCDAEAQLVKLETSKLASPGNVTASIVTVTTTDYYGDPETYKAVEVKWDAVGDADGYSVVITQEGKKTIYPISSGGYNNENPVSDSTGKIPDLDKWSTTIRAYNFPKGTWKIGVIAYTSGYGAGKEDSDPAWASGTVTID
jgi:hypothetical protein